jgi:hypothetical protein
LGDHETAQAWEQDPQILRRHSRDDLLLTHQQQQAVAVEPHGTHQDEKGAAQPADQAAGEQAVQVTEGSRQGEDLGGESKNRWLGWLLPVLARSCTGLRSIVRVIQQRHKKCGMWDGEDGSGDKLLIALKYVDTHKLRG